MAALARLQRRKGVMIALIAFVALLLAMGSGAAYAYFTANGQGSGVASVGTAKDVHVIAAAGTPNTPYLQPGTSADLTVTLNNPNSYAVNITGVSQNGTSVTVVHPSGTCSTTGVSVPTQTGLAVSVGPGSSVTLHISNGAHMDTTSDSGCQGAGFQIPVNLTVQAG